MKLKKNELRGALLGTLLGDGFISKEKAGKSAIQLHHAISQEAYIDYKKTILEQISGIRVSKRYGESRLNGKTFKSVKVETNYNIYSKKLRNLLYLNNIKVVTSEVLNKLTPLGLALLYCDDGSLTIRERKERTVEGKPKQFQFQARIWTCSFTYKEHLLLQQYFKQTLKIDIVINKCKRKWKDQVLEYYYLRFPSLEFKKFVEIIKPHVPPSMFYKIDYEGRINKLK